MRPKAKVLQSYWSLFISLSRRNTFFYIHCLLCLWLKELNLFLWLLNVNIFHRIYMYYFPCLRGWFTVIFSAPFVHVQSTDTFLTPFLFHLSCVHKEVLAEINLSDPNACLIPLWHLNDLSFEQFPGFDTVFFPFSLSFWKSKKAEFAFLAIVLYSLWRETDEKEDGGEC